MNPALLFPTFPPTNKTQYNTLGRALLLSNGWGYDDPCTVYPFRVLWLNTQRPTTCTSYFFAEEAFR